MSLEKRSKNSWRIRLTYRGRTYIKSMRGTEKEAAAEEERFWQEIITGSVPTSDLTLNKFVKGPYARHLRTLAPKTQADYQKQIEARISVFLGSYKLHEINPTLVMDFYDWLEKQNLGDRTIKKNAQILSAILTEAMYLQFIQANPCKRVRPPKYKRKNNDNYLEADDVRKLLAVVDKEPLNWQIAIYIGLFTGCRLGEICGLEWEDVDFQKREIHIKRSRQLVAKLGVIIKEPKNESSIRTTPAPDVLMSKLVLWRKEQERKVTYLGSDAGRNYVITYEDGSSVSPDCISAHFGKLVKRNGIKKVTFHGLRHTYATLLLHSRLVPEHAISENLGHSNPTTHKVIYAHRVEKSNRAAAEYLDTLVSG